MNQAQRKTQEQRRPGIFCPNSECGFFIEMSLPAILQRDQFICPGCGLRLTLDRANSRESLDAISQLQAAVENLEAVKKQYGPES